MVVMDMEMAIQRKSKGKKKAKVVMIRKQNCNELVCAGNNEELTELKN